MKDALSIVKEINIKDFFNQKTCSILFFCFAVLYLSFGLFLTYFSDIINSLNYDLIYSIDSGAAYWQLYIHDRFAAMKHPTIHILINPFIFLFKNFINNPKLVAVFLQSILQSFTVVIIYKIIFFLTSKKDISLLLTLMYGFSYTVLLLTSFTEVYVFAALGQVLFLSYFFHCYNNIEDKLELKETIILILLSVIGYGINLINIASCGIFILFLLCKTYKKQWKKIIAETLKIASIIALLILILLQCQTYVFNIKHRTSGVGHVRIGYEKGKILTTLKGTYVEPLYSLKSAPTSEINEFEKQDGTQVYLPRYLTLDKQNIVRYFPAIIIFLLPLGFYIKNNKKYNNRIIINLLLFIVGLYTFFNYSFYSYECALFALNYFPFLIILLGLLYDNFNPKIRNTIIGSFLIYEISINICNLFKIHNFLLNYDTPVHSYLFCIFVSVIIIGMLSGAVKLFKNIFLKQANNIVINDSYAFGLTLYWAFIVLYFIVGCMYRFVSA